MNQEVGGGEVLKSSYRMGQAWDQVLHGGMILPNTVFIDIALHSFKMQLNFPGLEEIGILSLYLSFNQMTGTLFIFSL